MGRKGASNISGGGGGRSAAEPVRMISITQQSVTDWMENHDAGQYLDAAPDAIQVNGMEFQWFAEQTTTDQRGNRVFGNDYQSVEQASNGEWPVIHVSVVERRTRNRTTYSFDRSPSTGTRLT